MAQLGCDAAYWFYEEGSPSLDALLLSLNKTLAALRKNPDSHGFVRRPITQKLYFMWVKNPDKLEDALLLTPGAQRDLALAVEGRLASFTGHLPLGVFLGQNPDIFESTILDLRPLLDLAFRACFAGFIPKTSEEFVRLVRSFSNSFWYCYRRRKRVGYRPTTRHYGGGFTARLACFVMA
jgi:hypothetical protein